MMLETCCYRVKLEHTVDILNKIERDHLVEEGEEMAKKLGTHFEGYWAVTEEPYSIKEARPILFFN